MHFITLYFLEQSDFQSTTGMSSNKIEISIKYHCLKSVQIRSFSYSIRMRENTDQKKLRIWAFFAQCIKLSIIPNGNALHCIANGLQLFHDIRSYYYSHSTIIKNNTQQINCSFPLFLLYPNSSL